MDCNLDWKNKNIAGFFPISQQILGVYEIGKGFYEIIAIICEAAAATFENLAESLFSKKPPPDHIMMIKRDFKIPKNLVFKTYTPNFRPPDENSDAEGFTPTWERLKESVTVIGVGILYFTPAVGTIYSGIQLGNRAHKRRLSSY